MGRGMTNLIWGIIYGMIWIGCKLLLPQPEKSDRTATAKNVSC
jgi:hypothetical protein